MRPSSSGLKKCLCFSQNLHAHCMIRCGCAKAQRALLPHQMFGAQIGSEDDQRMAKIHHAAFAVGQTAIFQNLQSRLDTSGCAFSISSNNTTLYGLRRTASVS